MELTKRNLTALFAALALLFFFLSGRVGEGVEGIPGIILLILFAPYLLSIWFNLKSKNKVARGFSAGLTLFPATCLLLVLLFAVVEYGDDLISKETIMPLLWIVCSITSSVFAFQENDEDDADEEYFEELEKAHEPQRLWGAIAAGAALLSFLFLPIQENPVRSYYEIGPENFNGIDFLSEAPLVLIAIIGLYALAIFASLLPGRVFRGFGVGVMGYLPIMFLVLLLFFKSKIGDLDFGIGVYLWMICSITSVVIAFLGNKSTKAEESEKITEETHAQEFENKVRQYSDEQLNEIVNSTNIYNDNLIVACKKELEIRKFRPFVVEKSDKELQKIIDNSEMYKPNMVRCCQVVLHERKKYRNVNKDNKIIDC